MGTTMYRSSSVSANKYECNAYQQKTQRICKKSTICKDLVSNMTKKQRFFRALNHCALPWRTQLPLVPLCHKPW